jgi:hypothetical protein
VWEGEGGRVREVMGRVRVQGRHRGDICTQHSAGQRSAMVKNRGSGAGQIQSLPITSRMMTMTRTKPRPPLGP